MLQRMKRRGPVNEAGWYSPTRRLSGVVVRSRETKEKRTGQPGVEGLVEVYVLFRLLARISSKYIRKGAVPTLRQNISIIRR